MVGGLINTLVSFSAGFGCGMAYASDKLTGDSSTIFSKIREDAEVKKKVTEEEAIATATEEVK